MSGLVVVNASLAFKWLVSEEHSDKARALSRSWADEGIQAAAPYLMPVELTNALHLQHLPLVHPFPPLGFGRVQLQYHRFDSLPKVVRNIPNSR